ncbi:hypothetical protein ACFFSW_08760 [Saccharothrix longispora]|uniref:Uncharacterized protein n=1 Tax=Saccharothrix longispora TaxID=33920 RepID=A0ABU1Q7R6_9PSEU|nr:hypothetical protein [Saccharothrix longispora]MDR6598731.1 hypothetical protein [Saccharothrix longispora]
MSGQVRGDLNVQARTIGRIDHGNRERWGVVALAVLGLALVTAVVLVVALTTRTDATAYQVEGTGRPGSADPLPATSTRTSAPARTSGPAAPPSDGLEVRLERGTALDLDIGQTEGQRAAGASGPFDVHLDQFNLLRSNSGGVHPYTGPPSEAGRWCADTLAAEPRADPVFATSPGLRYCFATSDGHPATVTVKEADLATYDTGHVVLDARVWR